MKPMMWIAAAVLAGGFIGTISALITMMLVQP